MFRSATAQVVLAGGTIGAVYFGLLAAPGLVWLGEPVGPVHGGGDGLEPLGWVGGLVALGFVLALCLPYRPYVLALRALGAGRATTLAADDAETLAADGAETLGAGHAAKTGGGVPGWLLVGMTVGLAGVGLAMYPRFGSDIFDYAGFERLWVVYGDNPLVALVSQPGGDWGAGLVWYPDRTPAYGPLWALLTWPIIRWAGTSVAGEVAGYKVLSALAYGLCCWLIWTSVEPPRRQRALVAFGWSPLVLFEVLGKVHNDILPALSMLAMVWLIGRARGVAAMLVVVAGALIKPTVLVAAPALAVSLWRSGGWRRLVLAAVGSLVLVVACYAPFWVGLPTLRALWQQTTQLGWSPATLVVLTLASVTGTQPGTAVHVALGLVWGVVCVLVLARQHGMCPSELAATSGWLVVAGLLLLTSAVFAHYFVPAVALAAVANDRRLERTVLVAVGRRPGGV